MMLRLSCKRLIIVVVRLDDSLWEGFPIFSFASLLL